MYIFRKISEVILQLFNTKIKKNENDENVKRYL